MEPVVVEKNVPIPGRRVAILFPFEKMNVGDSFLIPEGKRSAVAYQIQAYRSANPGAKFITRVIGTQIRCWRIA
jgi:hypothetical protein